MLKPRLMNDSEDGERGQLGVFMVLIMGAIALVVVSIVLLFGMDIAGSFADGIDSTWHRTATLLTRPLIQRVTRSSCSGHLCS